MSSRKSNNEENLAFAGRFLQICGTSEPAKVARLYNISYQSARNYLSGRLPDSYALLAIAEKTPYSIHWLLTGQGNKFVQKSIGEDTLPLSDQLREFVRRECRELVNEILSSDNETVQLKTVVLASEQIMEEKVIEKTVTFSGNQQ